MAIVKRHYIDDAYCKNQYAMFRDDLPRDIKYVREHAGRSLSFLATNALFTGYYASVVAPMDTGVQLRLSGEATTAMFALGFTTKKNDFLRAARRAHHNRR